MTPRPAVRAAGLLCALLLAAPALAQGAFRQPEAALTAEQRFGFRLGEAVFRRLWVSAPASTRHADGLGPLFNARSCQGCHIGNGRGRAPSGLVARISVPPSVLPFGAEAAARLAAGTLGWIDEPRYGAQLQPFAVQGLAGEPRLVTEWREEAVTLADGTAVPLRRPLHRTEAAPGMPPLHPDAMLSPRLAPPMIGLGLLETVPEAQILALADPADADGDGIRGRPNSVWSAAAGRPVLGRFGWKAGEPDLPRQVASAAALDLGLSTPPRPEPWGDCTPAQPACRAAPHGLAAGQRTELGPALFDLLLHFTRHLAVPPRRDTAAPAVRRGEALFAALGCAACHNPRFTLADGRAIAPYTDLLLHDMGEDLADGRPEWRAGGRDWRTPPLWGLGLTRAVSGETALLHDGRARSALEAILWHGGEARPARERVVGLPAADRAALLAFLESL